MTSTTLPTVVNLYGQKNVNQHDLSIDESSTFNEDVLNITNENIRQIQNKSFQAKLFSQYDDLNKGIQEENKTKDDNNELIEKIKNAITQNNKSKSNEVNPKNVTIEISKKPEEINYYNINITIQHRQFDSERIAEGCKNCLKSMLQTLIKNKYTLLFLLILFIVVIPCQQFSQSPQNILALGEIFGVAVASYSVIANDSIQTMGTFIEVNKNIKWYYKTLFISTIWIVTCIVGWFLYDQDISFGRLSAKGLDKDPTEFSYLQLASPIILLVLTKLKIPVSSSFMILSCFTTSSKSFGKIVIKSVQGFGLAFISSFIVQLIFGKLIQKLVTNYKTHVAFKALLWITTAYIWQSQLMHIIGKFSVYLPRAVPSQQLIIFVVYLTLGLTYLLIKGENIQDLVKEKTRITDERESSVINIIFACCLIFFITISNIPMSTTFVFLGLLGGREICYSILKIGNLTIWQAIKMCFFKDLGKLIIGFLVSLLVGVIENESLRRAVFGGK